MQVKKFRARAIEEAISRIKNDLGADAMILSTRKIEGNAGNCLFEIAAIPAGKSQNQKNDDILDEVKSELMSIKEMIYILNHSSNMTDFLTKNPEALNLYTTLIRNGVTERNAKILMKNGGTFDKDFFNNSETIREKIIKELMNLIKQKNPFETTNSKRTIAAFIGTTGVGKTTTIAKLAAQLMLKKRKKVGLISIDNYRIGALEQLRAYSSILGIPCFPAFNRADLLLALNRLDNRDVVLIDTAGLSQYNMKRIDELNCTLLDNMEISTHLLLNTATAESVMHQTAVNFSALKFQSYIFTKIDEADTCGIIINQIMKLNTPISFLTNGQNVPEDIEVAEKQRIIEYIFKKKRKEW